MPNASFQPTIVVKGLSSAYAFDATLKVNDPALIELVKSQTAEYALHIECQATRYRALYASFSEQFEFQIPANTLDGPVEICSFVLASQDIPTYTNPGFHKDYSNFSFLVHKGDTLAVGPDRTFIAEKKIDPLRRIPSIFIVVPDEKPDAPPLDVDTSGDKVRILLSQGNHDRYSFLRQS